MIGNDRYQGNHINVIEAVTSELDWNLRIQLAPDGRLGAPTQDDPDTGWNGMVGEVLRQVSVMQGTRKCGRVGVTVLGAACWKRKTMGSVGL